MESREATIQMYIDHIENDAKSHIESLKLEYETTLTLLKNNLQLDLMSLPKSIKEMSMAEFLDLCAEYHNMNFNNHNNNNNTTTTTTTSTTTTTNNSNNIATNTFPQSLSELLMSPSTPSLNNNNNNNNNSTPSDTSIDDIRQTVISILNSPQLLVKKRLNN
ncbi:hypothetical protein CYY_008961 [Polysphondylium violaceum]|uniref:Borealin N-terminal domain-containing protein n=1 Tax=Polysphondylium violaceum TaxID=133409 RepID=A0A8J4UWI0_9MYCE|nr:hypothetical protein CYY_008961 [Polysphondylium violaceum]